MLALIAYAVYNWPIHSDFSKKADSFEKMQDGLKQKQGILLEKPSELGFNDVSATYSLKLENRFRYSKAVGYVIITLSLRRA